MDTESAVPPPHADEPEADPLTERRWQAVVRRDPQADGEFVYAVRTTGVYCRPSCPSRAAKRENMAFFDTATLAAAAGYRPCQRCRPDAPSLQQRRHALVRQACEAIEHGPATPTLAQLARQAGMSPYHFQRIFKAVTGLSPKAYHQALQANRVTSALQTAPSVTAAIYDAGFNSPGRCRRAHPLRRRTLHARLDRHRGDPQGNLRHRVRRRTAGAGRSRADPLPAGRVRAGRRCVPTLGRPGAAPYRTAARRAGPAAGRAGYGPATPRLASAAGDPGRPDRELRRARRTSRPAEGPSCRGARLRRQSRGDGDPLPPCRARGRVAGRIPLGPRTQGGTAEAGSGRLSPQRTVRRRRY